MGLSSPEVLVVVHAFSDKENTTAESSKNKDFCIRFIRRAFSAAVGRRLSTVGGTERSMHFGLVTQSMKRGNGRPLTLEFAELVECYA